MGKGWEESAPAWIASLGERGDWGREHVLDPVMLGRIVDRRFGCALDVGCGEGRFCRMLREAGIVAVGIDPTLALIEEARKRDPVGDYRLGRAEALPFEPATFDLVVSYLTLIDIGDFRSKRPVMAALCGGQQWQRLVPVDSQLERGLHHVWDESEPWRRRRGAETANLERGAEEGDRCRD